MDIATFSQIKMDCIDRKKMEEIEGEREFERRFREYKKCFLDNAILKIEKALIKLAHNPDKEFEDVWLVRYKQSYTTEHFTWSGVLDQDEIMGFLKDKFHNFQLLLEDYFILDGMQTPNNIKKYVLVVRIGEKNEKGKDS